MPASKVGPAGGRSYQQVNFFSWLEGVLGDMLEWGTAWK